MFGKCVKVDPSVKELERQLKISKDVIEAQNVEIATLKELMKGQYSTAKYSVNWHMMQPFSIERMMINGIQKTVLGYLSEDGSVREWTFYCSHEEHQRLVEEFDQYRKEYDEQLQKPCVA
jgi:hypothetical protein